MLLYHGTTLESALNILKCGFDFNHSGKNWGNTYGKGIYFTPKYDVARLYAGDDGIVISINYDILDYTILKKFQSPSSKKKNYKNKWIITPDLEEYIMLY